MHDTRTPDQLLRDAVAIRRILDDTGDDDYAGRIRLVASQDRVRLEAARQWYARGWRPITEAPRTTRAHRTLMLAPLLAVAAAALLSRSLLSTGGPALLLSLVAVAGAPLAAEWRGADAGRIRRLAALGAAALGLHLATGPIPAALVFLPGTALLTATALAGVAPRTEPRLSWPEDSAAS